MNRPVVILCGFMGVGKSRIGAELSRLLDVPFIDTDAVIETRAGASIAEIFATDGEVAFRRMESELCRTLDVAGGAVVATGGGMIVDPDNFARLDSLGTMVLLESNPETIAARIGDAADRPRLQANRNLDGIRSLLDERRDAYDRISFRIATDERTPTDVASEIAERIRYGEDVVRLRADTRPLPGSAPSARATRVVVRPGATAELARWMDVAGLGGPAVIIAPGVIADRYRDRLSASFASAGRAVQWIPIDDGDANKTLAQAEQLLDTLADAGVGRDGAVIAAGGGVTGDLAGFVAATYMRGIALVHVPTTLLAQVDSSIGGKVGVNRPQAKNLVGTIYPPHLVVTDIELLQSLPQRDLAAGMAEVVKTAIVGDAGLFSWLRGRAGGGAIALDADTLDRCVRACVRVKARIVDVDPYERDLRRVLNLGHTLGHALEAAAGYDVIRHGEAIAVGLAAAVRLAVARSGAAQSFLDDTLAILSACGLDTTGPAVSPDALRRAMSLDKKRRAGKLTFVLPLAPGRVEIVDDVSEDEILSAASTDGTCHGKERP